MPLQIMLHLSSTYRFPLNKLLVVDKKKLSLIFSILTFNYNFMVIGNLFLCFVFICSMLIVIYLVVRFLLFNNLHIANKEKISNIFLREFL